MSLDNGNAKHRTNIYLTQIQIKMLDEKAKELGLSRSELIRNLLDERLGLNKIAF